MMRIELGTLVFLIVDPSNMRNLRAGISLCVDFVRPAEKLVLMYTPDLEWVREQIAEPLNTPLTIDKLLVLITMSRSRPEAKT